MYNKTLFVLRHLLSVISYSLFPILLLATFYIIYIIDMSTPHICDDNNWYYLYQLKNSLTLEINNFRTTIVNYECYSTLREQLAEVSRTNFRDFGQETLLDDNITNTRAKMELSYNRLRDIENSIRSIQPDFRSSINYSCTDYIRAFRSGRG